jgi:hypothetical protein
MVPDSHRIAFASGVSEKCGKYLCGIELNDDQENILEKIRIFWDKCGPCVFCIAE